MFKNLKKPNDLEDIQGQYIGLIKVRADFIGEFCSTWRKLARKATYDGKNFDNMYMTSFIREIYKFWNESQAAFTNGWLEMNAKRCICIVTASNK